MGVQVPPRPRSPLTGPRAGSNPGEQRDDEVPANAVIPWKGRGPPPRGAGQRGRGGGRAYDTTKVPVMVVGCTSQRKKYVPGFSAGTLYVVIAGPLTSSPLNSAVVADASV